MMRQPYAVSIAARYLRARSRSAFISFISAVSMLGMTLSVAVLIVVMAVINGFETELERRILSVSANATLTGVRGDSAAPLDDWRTLGDFALARDDVEAVAPFVEGPGMIGAADELLGVSVRGVDPELERGISSLYERVVEGSFDALGGDGLAAGEWPIVIGRSLAQELGVAVGDPVTLYLPEIRVTFAGAWPRRRELTVAGIFEVGMAEFDRGLVLVSFDHAATLYRTGGRASGVSLRVGELYEARRIVLDVGSAAIDRFGGNFIPDDWSYRHSNIFRSIELTKPILFIVLSLVMAIAAFNIVSTLIMVVRDKRGDIAILRTLGSAPRNILSIFVVQGSCIGVIGMLGGLALGLALVASLDPIVGLIESWFAIDLLDAEVYAIGDLATEARPDETARICALALGLAVLATLYPAWRASRQPPAAALRNE